MPVPRPGAAGSRQAVVARYPRREHVAALALWPLPRSTSAATAATPWSSRAAWWPPRATARAPNREGFQDQGGREVTGPSPPTPRRATYGNQRKLRHFTPHEGRPEPGKWSRRKPCRPSSRGSRPATARTGSRAGQHSTEQTLGAPRRDIHVADGLPGRGGRGRGSRRWMHPVVHVPWAPGPAGSSLGQSWTHRALLRSRRVITQGVRVPCAHTDGGESGTKSN